MFTCTAVAVVWAEDITIAIDITMKAAFIQAVALNFPMGAVTDSAAVRKPLRPLIHLMSLPHALPFRTLTRFQVVNSRLQGRVLSLQHVQHALDVMQVVLQLDKPHV